MDTRTMLAEMKSQARQIQTLQTKQRALGVEMAKMVSPFQPGDRVEALTPLWTDEMCYGVGNVGAVLTVVAVTPSEDFLSGKRCRLNVKYDHEGTEYGHISVTPRWLVKNFRRKE